VIRDNDLLLPGRDPIRLRAGHLRGDHSMALASPDGRYVIALSTTGLNSAQYVVDRVEVATGAVASVSRGRALASARVGPSGYLYLQIGHELRRLPRFDAEWVDADRVAPGVLLVPETFQYRWFCMPGNPPLPVCPKSSDDVLDPAPH